MAAETLKPSISLIIPTLNDAVAIEATLTELPPASEVEIIVADGGSRDTTWDLMDRFPGVRWLISAPGRGLQMNAGAAASCGELLVFLHADCGIDPAHLDTLRAAALDPAFAAGAFDLQLTPPRPALRLISWGANLRCRLFSLPFGDQAITVRRRLFFALGGYAHRRPEDLDLVLRLKKFTRLRRLTPPLPSSGRRWLTHGYLRTTTRHWRLILWHLAERRLSRRWPHLGDLRSP